MVTLSVSYAGTNLESSTLRNDQSTFLTNEIQSNSEKNLNSHELKKLINEDLGIMNQKGLAINFVKEAYIEHQNIVYLFDYQTVNLDVQSKVIVERQNNNDVSLTITEGDLTNELEYRGDEKIFIDGQLISSEEVISGANGNLRSAGSWYSTAPPNQCGSASDYTISGGSTQNKNVNLSKAISRYTVTALAAALGGYLGFKVGASIGLATATFLVTEMMPNDQYFSIKKNIYYSNKTGQFMHGSLIGCQKEKFTTYAQKDFKGKSQNGEQFYWLSVY